MSEAGRFARVLSLFARADTEGTSTIRCTCGASFTWEGADAGLGRFVAAHESCFASVVEPAPLDGFSVSAAQRRIRVALVSACESGAREELLIRALADALRAVEGR